MTTTVNIQVPAPNHNSVKVTMQSRLEDGTWVDDPESNHNPITLGHNHQTTQHVFGTRRLILEEIPITDSESVHLAARLIESPESSGPV